MSRQHFYSKRHDGSVWRSAALPPPPPPLGDLIETISKVSLSDGNTSDDPVRISNVRPIASYNWVVGLRPKIMIPGKPPRWTPLTEPRRLQEDKGRYYRDVNAASYPQHPLEPAVVSILQMCPKPIPVDVVACGSTLGNLLRFCRGIDQDLSFRMLVEVVGDTVHLIRRENSPRELIPGVRGYGHTFPEAYTTWDADVKQSKSHHRVVSYSFGGLDFLVRFNGDGFVPDETTDPPPASSKGALSDGDPTALLSNLQLENFASSSSNSSRFDLQVVEEGHMVPQSTIFDLKTRTIHARDKDILGSQLARLWVAQIEKFALAFHTRGLFEIIEVKNVRAELDEWEDINQSSLQRLAALIALVIDRARKTEDGKMEIVYSPGSPLELRKQFPGVGNAFSEPVKEAWSAWLEARPRTSKDRAIAEELSEGDEPSTWSDVDSIPDLSGDNDSEPPDYTACDLECGYCGKCDY